MRNPSRPQEEEHLTIREAATEAQCSQTTIRRHIVKGALKTRTWQSTHRLRIRRSEFERYLKG